MRSWMIGFIVAVVAATRLPQLPGMHYLALFAALGLLLTISRRHRHPVSGGALVGLSLACWAGQNLLQERLAHDCVQRPLMVLGSVASLPQVKEMNEGRVRQRFVFVIESLSDPACTGPRRVVLSYYGDQTIEPGERWRFQVKLKRPWGTTNASLPPRHAWYSARRIGGVGHVQRPHSAEKLVAARLPDGFLLHRVRREISRAIAAQGLPEDEMAVLQAIAVADKNQISPGLWRLFRDFGISHLLVVSGLHVGLVAGSGLLLGSFLQRLLPLGPAHRWLSFGAALIPAAGYAALAGFSLPTQRALFMLSVFLCGSLLGRPGTGFSRLLIGAVLVLLVNPLAPVSSGFWLSFGAVAALLFFALWHSARPKWMQVTAVHAYMSVAMLPLTASFFGGGSALSMFANMAMIPLLGLLVVPLVLAGVLCHLLELSLAGELWRLAAWFLAGTLEGLNALAAWPALPSFVPLRAPFLAVALAVVGTGLLIVPAGRTLRCCALLLLLPLLLPAVAIPGLGAAAAAVSVTALDVGQGTAVLIRAAGRTLLYDTGGGDPAGNNFADSVLLPYLNARGVQALDTFVVSHGDNDHSSGVGAVQSAMPVARLRFGEETVGVKGGKPCRAGEAWRWSPRVQFQFLSPTQERALKGNNSSCVLMAELDGYRVILAGDIEKQRERELVAYWRDELRADLLLVPHHGSETSSSHVLVKTVQPALALVSAGYANRFGHPRQAVVERLEQGGASVLNTAESGALQLLLEQGRPVNLRSARNFLLPYWW